EGLGLDIGEASDVEAKVRVLVEEVSAENVVAVAIGASVFEAVDDTAQLALVAIGLGGIHGQLRSGARRRWHVVIVMVDVGLGLGLVVGELGLGRRRRGGAEPFVDTDGALGEG